MLKSALMIAREAGVIRMELATAITNIVAQRLSEHVGSQWDKCSLYDLSLSLRTTVGQSFGAVAWTSSVRMVFIHSAAMVLRSSMDMPA